MRDSGRVTPSWTAHWSGEDVLTAVDHFGHRQSGGIVVDLFWNRRNLTDEFRVEVEDERGEGSFVLHPRTGRDAIEAFYHPFAATRTAAPRPSAHADNFRRET